MAITGGDGSSVGDDGEGRRSNVQRIDGRKQRRGGKAGDRREEEKEKKKERGRVLGRYRWMVVSREERIKLAAGAIGMMDKEVRMITRWGGETVSQMGLGPAVGTFYSQ